MKSSQQVSTALSLFRVGCSGWQYKHWRGDLYPAELPATRWLEHYAARFDTVEINNTFYRLPSAESFASWRDRVPRGFLYAVKASRFLTHMKKLKDPEEPIERILGRARHLRDHMGPILYQLPRGWKCNVERLAEFFIALPRDLVHVMEFRRADWLCDEVYELMRKYGIGLCIHDLLPHHPRVVTANVVYIRFHGSGKKWCGSYPNSELHRWADWMTELATAGHDVYAYFNNDAEAYAVRNAQTMREMVTTQSSARR